MNPRRTWFSCGELAGLPGLPTSSRGVSEKAKREGWKVRHRSKQGGGSEYHLSALPTETQVALQLDQVEGTSERLPPATTLDAKRLVLRHLARELSDEIRRHQERTAVLADAVARLQASLGEPLAEGEESSSGATVV